jgi:hypothetical protein
MPNLMTEERRAELYEMYEKVKEKYEIPVCRVCKIEGCEECKKKRINHTWTKVDLVTMAVQVGIPSLFIEICYYIPMEETHPKVGAILRRIKSDDEKSYQYDESPRANDEKDVLWSAHFFLLQTLEVLKTHLHMDILDDPLRQCRADYKATWAPYGMAETT